MENYLLLMSIHAACVGLILIAIVFKRGWMRPLAVVGGMVSIWLPLFILFESLGHPNPYTPTGQYRVISSKMHDDKDELYMFVDMPDADYTPRVYMMPFPRDDYERAQSEGDYEQQIVAIEQNANGEFEIIYVDYMPPDMLKGEAMRGWTPREE